MDSNRRGGNIAATKRRRTKGAGGVFRDKAGKWHFRTEITADPGTEHRRIIETTGLVKSDARQRHESKLREYERTGIIHSISRPTCATTSSDGAGSAAAT